MKEQNGSEKKKVITMTKEKKFYLLTAVGCALTLVAIILVAVLVPNQNAVDDPTANKPGNSVEEITSEGPEANDKESGENNEPVVNTPEGMQMPLETVSIIHDYGFYHNTTLNIYYEHEGLDFTAAAGTDVLAAESGVIESIYKEDILLGTEIVIDHGDGLKTVYRFVTEAEGLKVGDEVEKGQVIATIAEANGNEYKDGAHLHFEILQDGKNVDPALHLTLEEK